MKYLSLLLFILGVPSVYGAPANDGYAIKGIITDANSGEPVSFAYIHLEELHRAAVADISGYFELTNIPSGLYTVMIHRIGYRTLSLQITILESDRELNLKLEPTVLSSQAIQVIGNNEEFSGSNMEHTSKKVLGSDLRRDLGSTLSQTLSNLPGFDQRTMGSSTGRPVIRGLGDERVLILQDGMEAGDVSSQSSDHAVTIDPISAEEVEIARGPAALAYGANAIGGVVNVVRNIISPSLPEKINGSITLNGESVNESTSGAINANAPIGTFALKMDINGRVGSNTHTPVGTLKNTDYKATNDAIGLSWIRNWGYIGGSFNIYKNNYGIPPDPNGHPNGVNVEMIKFQYDLKSEVVLNGAFLKVVEGDFSIKNYNHKEIESSGAVGTEFGLVTTNATIKVKHGHLLFFDGGSFGIMGELQDYAVDGAGTPDANSYKLGTYFIQESNFSALHLETGLRFDWVYNKPIEESYSYVIGQYRKGKEFSAVSGSVSGIYALGEGFAIGTTLLHSFRAPSLEELYSEGPHLASYSYEIGNPKLKPERGLAKELFLRYRSNKANSELALYHNSFSNYLYAQNTGNKSNRFPRLYEYQFVGADAVIMGFELSSEFQLTKNFVLSTSFNYTVADREVTDEEKENTGYTKDTRPLPQIPPFKAQASLKYAKKSFEAGTRIKLAAKQDRTGEFETSTDGYALVDLFTQYRLQKNKLLHTFSVNVNNLLNEEYRSHLSRIKEFNPEPGINVSLLYRLYF